MKGIAFGKVILLGEHAVVYGVPAMAVGIDRGADAIVAATAPDAPSELVLNGIEFAIQVNGDSDLSKAFRALLEVSGASLTGLRVQATTSLPPGGGLGCSAALGVAIAHALQPTASEFRLQECAMAWERVFHGNPSGIDAAVATLGGCIWFRRGGPPKRVQLHEPLRLCVGQSGVLSSTRSMVEMVAKFRERRPEVVAKAFEGIDSLVQNALLALQAGDHVGLGRLMDLNQMILSGLFLSTGEIERLCSLARDSGALGAKLTGAGGGGCVVALVDRAEAAARVLTAWREAGFEGFETIAHPTPVENVTLVAEEAP